MSYALQQVVKTGTGKNALALGRPAAGKTGTATNGDGNVSSSWFVGYTPQLRTAVMYVRGDGNDNLNCVERHGKTCTPGYLRALLRRGVPHQDLDRRRCRQSLDGAPVEQFPPPANVPAKQADHAPQPTFTPAPSPTQQPTKKPSRDAEPDADPHADADPDAHADPHADADPDADGAAAELAADDHPAESHGQRQRQQRAGRPPRRGQRDGASPGADRPRDRATSSVPRAATRW